MINQLLISNFPVTEQGNFFKCPSPVRTTEKEGWAWLYSVCYSDEGNSVRLTESLGSAVSLPSCLWRCRTLAPTDLFIDTGSAAQSPNPDSIQGGIRGDWKTQRPCSDAHLNKLVHKNTSVEDMSTKVKEWDMDHSTADGELSKNTLDNRSVITSPYTLTDTLNLQQVRGFSAHLHLMNAKKSNDYQPMMQANQLINMMKCLQLITNRGRENTHLIWGTITWHIYSPITSWCCHPGHTACVQPQNTANQQKRSKVSAAVSHCSLQQHVLMGH